MIVPYQTIMTFKSKKKINLFHFLKNVVFQKKKHNTF